MFDLREHENLIQSLVAEANQNDPQLGVDGQTNQQERG